MNRKKRLLFFWLTNIALCISALFLVFVAKFVYGTPLAKITDCPAHMILGIYCPLCGGTRAISSLLKGDILSSLIYNPAVLPSIIAFIVYDIITFKAILQNKSDIIKIHKPVWISLVAILVLNWIVRNSALLIFDIDYIAALS